MVQVLQRCKVRGVSGACTVVGVGIRGVRFGDVGVAVVCNVSMSVELVGLVYGGKRVWWKQCMLGGMVMGVELGVKELRCIFEW